MDFALLSLLVKKGRREVDYVQNEIENTKHSIKVLSFRFHFVLHLFLSPNICCYRHHDAFAILHE